jgi:hypothetical protein
MFICFDLVAGDVSRVGVAPPADRMQSSRQKPDASSGEPTIDLSSINRCVADYQNLNMGIC